MHRFRVGAIALSTTLLLSLASVTGQVVTAAPANAVATCDTGSLTNDINGDGFPDLVAGDPSATVGSAAGAGRIVVRYGTNARDDSGPQDALNQHDAVASLAAAAHDHFGAVLAVGLIDSDDCADVVVGAPGDRVGSAAGAGSVQVIFGSTDGLGQGRPGLSIDAATGGLGTHPVSGEGFGSALALTDRVAGQNTHLAIGVPLRNVGSATDAGAVALVDFSPSGEGAIKAARTISQSSPGVDGASEKSDHFGAALGFGAVQTGCGEWCKALIVGAPGENSGAGDVVVINGTSTAGHYTSTVWSQNTSGVAGTSHAGDGFGSAVSWQFYGATGRRFLAVGIPGKNVGSATNAGAVQLFRYSATLSASDDEQITQDTSGVSGTAESGDHFGSVVLLTEYDAQTRNMGLVVGIPDEDDGSLVDAGAIALFNAADTAPGDSDASITQDSPDVPGDAAAGEHFGAAVGLGFSDDSALIGVPDDHGYSHGAVLSVPWVTVTGEFLSSGFAWHPITGSRFGAALPADGEL